jgi:uncharacterized membrane protein SpoIIM required for sporulation
LGEGFDVDRFVRERTPEWQELERLLSAVDAEGMRVLGIGGARRLGRLYRAVSADLVRARTELAEASVVDHLNDLVARAYARVHAGRSHRARKLLAFFTQEFPRTVRQEWRPIALSGALLLSGAAFGAVTAGVDPASVQVTIPGMFQHDPAERVAHDEATARDGARHDAAIFSTYLFTHNTQVSFLVFVLGITLGIGTVALLLYNGAPLGALAWQYHAAGHDLFFWAWILPHGIPELTAVAIAGGAGLILARGLWLPGRRRRRDALVAEARTAVRLVVGAMSLLILAGLIEGTISQIHAPRLPYGLKLLFALVVGTGVYAFLLRGGRKDQGVVEGGTLPANRASASRSSMTSA